MVKHVKQTRKLCTLHNSSYLQFSSIQIRIIEILLSSGKTYIAHQVYTPIWIVYSVLHVCGPVHCTQYKNKHTVM